MKDLVVSGNTTFDTITATGNITTNAAFYSSISGLYVNNKQAIFASTASDTWLRINANKAFTSGTYYGSSVVRTDGELQVGSSGAYLKSNSSNTTIANLVAPVASIASITGTKGIYDNFQVLDELRAKRYSLESIQSLGGSFLIAPVLYFSTNCTVQISAISGTTVTAAIIDSSTINTDTVGGVQWSQYSKVKISGKLGNVVLGTCTGTLTAKMNTTAGRINLTFTFDDASSLSVKTYAASEISDLAVMIYEKGVNSTTSYPVGIFMTGYGTNNASYIDIYNAETSRTKPRVRLGKLDELDSTIKVGGITPSGFGLYATNAFLEGAIHATSGVMGGWTLSDDKIYHTANAPGSTSTVLSPGGVNSTLSIGGSPASTQNTWAFTVKNKFGITTAGKLYCSDADIAGKVAASSGEIGGFEITSSAIKTKNVAVTSNADNSVSLSSSDFTRTVAGASRTNLRFAIGGNFGVDTSGNMFCSGGKIGGWTITTSALYNGTDSMTSTTAGLYLGTAGIRNYKSATAYTNIQNGVISAVGADISGKITATQGAIGGFEITSTAVKTKNVAVTSNADNSISLSSADFTRTINNTSRSGLRFAMGDKFGVTGDGIIYASSADITGKITATSGEIGGCSITNGVLSVPAANISGTLTASQIAVGMGGNLYANYDTFSNITNDTLYYNKDAHVEATIDTNKNGYYGWTCAKLKTDDSGTDGYVYFGSPATNYGCIRVVTGKKYRVSAYMKSSSASTSIDLYVVGHSSISNANNQHTQHSETIGTSWTRVEMTYTAVSSYPYISVRVDLNKASTTLYVDAIQVEEVASNDQVASPFSPASPTAIDGNSIIANEYRMYVGTDSVPVLRLDDCTPGTHLMNLVMGYTGNCNIVLDDYNDKINISSTGSIDLTGNVVMGSSATAIDDRLQACQIVRGAKRLNANTTAPLTSGHVYLAIMWHDASSAARGVYLIRDGKVFPIVSGSEISFAGMSSSSTFQWSNTGSNTSTCYFMRISG